MANLFTPAEAATVAAKLTASDSLLSALVSRNFENDLLGGGKANAPVSVKLPTTLISRDRAVDEVTAAIVLDEITERRETIALAPRHDYSAIPLSEADLTLNLKDFSTQVLKPQAEAIVDSLEHKVASALLGVPVTVPTVAWDALKPAAFFTAARKSLRDNGVSPVGLNAIVGTAVYAALVDSDELSDASKSASTDALREAGVGRIRGFNIVESTRVPEDEIILFHKDAVTLVTRAPIVPQGASFGATITEGGFSLRYLRDYDAMHTVDRSIVSTFSGVGILPTYKVSRNYETREVTFDKIANGGVLHFDTVAAV